MLRRLVAEGLLWAALRVSPQTVLELFEEARRGTEDERHVLPRAEPTERAVEMLVRPQPRAEADAGSRAPLKGSLGARRGDGAGRWR
jgi:hypothetical protein